MLFTWDTRDLCIVFKEWHVTGTWSLLFSLLAVAALTAGYEAVREASRRYEAGVAVQDKRGDDSIGASTLELYLLIAVFLISRRFSILDAENRMRLL